MVSHREVWLGEERFGAARQARFGEVRFGVVVQGVVWQVPVRQARYVKASSGRVWLREARLVKAWQAWKARKELM